MAVLMSVSRAPSKDEAGTIKLWYGAEVDIPSGWIICDGENGTPDLQNKFPIGAGDTYAVEDTGGEATHRHDNSGAHQHHVGHDGSGTNLYLSNMYGQTYQGGPWIRRARDGTASLAKNDAKSSTYGNHRHDELSNLPPFVAVFFIMKT